MLVRCMLVIVSNCLRSLPNVGDRLPSLLPHAPRWWVRACDWFDVDGWIDLDSNQRAAWLLSGDLYTAIPLRAVRLVELVDRFLIRSFDRRDQFHRDRDRHTRTDIGNGEDHSGGARYGGTN